MILNSRVGPSAAAARTITRASHCDCEVMAEGSLKTLIAPASPVRSAAMIPTKVKSTRLSS